MDEDYCTERKMYRIECQGQPRAKHDKLEVD